MPTETESLLGLSPTEQVAAAAPAPASAAPQPTTESADSDTDRLLAGDDAHKRLSFSMEQAQNTTPETAAKVLRLHDQTGLPQDVVGENLQEIEKQTNAKAFDAKAYQQEAPVTAAWMAENPNHAAVAQKDLGALAKLERFFKNDLADPFLRDMDNQKRWALGEKALLGTITPDDRKELARLDESIAQRTPNAPQSLFDSTLQIASGNIPTLGRGLWEGAKAAAVGAVGGALATGGPGAIPAATASFPIGMAAYFGRMEAANSYLEFEKRGISRPIALGASLVSGTLNGVMMGITGGTSSKIAVPALESLSRKGLTELLSSHLTRDAVGEYLQDIGKQMGVLGSYNATSSLIHSGTREVAMMASDGSLLRQSPIAILNRIFSPENIAAAGEAAKSGMQGGFALGLSTGALELYGKVSRANEAVARAKSFEEAGVNLSTMAMMEHSPEQVEGLVEKATKNTPNEFVYLPMDSFNKYWHEKGIDPRDVYQTIMGNGEGYDEATRTGQDLQIPTSKWAVSIGRSEHNKFFSQEIKTDPTQMNAREAQEFAKDQVKQADAAAAQTPADQALPAQPENTAPKTEIVRAEEQQGMKPLFTDPKAVGMTDSQATSYTKAVYEAHDKAEKAMTDALMRRAERVRKEVVAEERDKVQSAVTAEVDQRKEQIVRSVLQDGKLPGGADLPDGMPKIKLSKESLAQDYPKFDTKTLPRGVAVSKTKATKVEIGLLADKMRSDDKAIFKELNANFDRWNEVIKSGIHIPKDVKEEGNRLPLWMRKSQKNGGRPLDEIRQNAMEQGLIGPNDDIIQALMKLKRPEALDTKAEYFEKARRQMEQEYSSTGGIHPDAAAAMFGYPSGQSLLDALSKSSDRGDLIEKLTDERMKPVGDVVPFQDMAKAAMNAVHNERRSELLVKELKYLISDDFAQFKNLVRRISRRVPSVEEIRSQAMEQIDAKVVRDTNPGLYQRAEAQASREAVEHMLKGNFDGAFEAKQRELLNHELYMASAKARDQADQSVAYMSRFNKESVRTKLEKAGANYMAQIDDILDRFEFRRVTLKDLDKRADLRAWMEDQRAQGYDVSMPEKVLQDAYRKNYKDLTNGELRDIQNSVGTIAHLAKLKNELLANKAARDFDVVKTQLINDLLANHDIDIKGPVPERVKAYSLANNSQAWMTRMEFLFDRLGGYKPGNKWLQHLFQPTVDAAAAEREMMGEKVADLRKIFSAYSRDERALWYYKQIDIPEIGTALYKPNILAAALNWGNAYNREAMMRGYGWTEAQVQAMFKHLDSRDWQTVGKIWEHLDGYRPDIGAMEKRLNGVEPEWVQAEPFTIQTADGKTMEMRGGYYPIRFDSGQSFKQRILESKAEVREMFGGQWARAQTRQGHLEERVGTAGKPLLLQLGVLTDHVSNVIHDITHRETIIDLNKLINDEDIRAHIQAATGKEMYSQLNPWLRHIAGERFGDPMDPLEGLYTHARMGAMLANLGAKFTSALVHTLNYTMAINELGPEYSAKGFAEAFSNPTKLAEKWEMIKEKSPSMRGFIDSYDRDVRDMFKSMAIAGTKEGPLAVADAYTHDMQRALFKHYGYMYLGVSIPTWLGAYSKAMDGALPKIRAGDEMAAVDYADHVVRTTIASAGAKDLPNIMQKQGLTKLFTMYYGPMNLVFNNFAKSVQQYKVGNYSLPRLMGAATLTWFVPAVMQNVLRGRTPGEDDSTLGWIGKSIAEYPFETVVGLRDLERAFASSGHDLSLTPAADVANSLVKAAAAVRDRTIGDKDELSRQDMKNMAMSVGYFTGLPARQAWVTAEYLHDWMTGDEQPDNAMEGVWRSLVGKKAKP